MKTMCRQISVFTLSFLMILSLFCFAAGAQDDATSDMETSEMTEAGTEISYAMQCPECSALAQGQPYCSSCGAEMPEAMEQWTCQHICNEDCKHQNRHDDTTPCGAINDGEYCGSCGNRRPADEADVDFNFIPAKFVENLKYMAAGMVGIFLVIGVIILTIVVLGKVTAPKNKDPE